MRKITGRDIQVLVAGALASGGFHAWIGFAHDVAIGGDSGAIFSWAMIGLTFPMGIGILLRSGLALQSAQLYLWFMTVGGGIALIASGIVKLGTFHIPFVGAYGVGVAADAILLALLYWSKSSRFADAENP